MFVRLFFFLLLLKSVTGSDSNDLETDLNQSLSIKDKSSVEHERGLVHAVVNLLPIKSLELVPFGSDNDCLCASASVHSGLGDGDGLLDLLSGDLTVVGQVEPDLRLGHFRVVN